VTERELFLAYAAVLSAACCCGGHIVAGNDPDAIEWAVRRHNLSERHCAWAIAAGWR